MNGRNNMIWTLMGGVAFLMVVGCLVGFVLFRGIGFGGAYYGWGSGMMGGSVSWRGVGMLLFGLVVLAGVLIAGTGHLPNLFRRSDEARTIASERYARGEISQEEYEKIRKGLE